MNQRKLADTLDADHPNDDQGRIGFYQNPDQEEVSEPQSDSEEMTYEQFVVAK